MQRTLAIIKPDAVERRLAGTIIQRIEDAEFKIRSMRLVRLTKPAAEGFYAVHRDRPFFDSLTDFMSSGPVVVLVLEAPDENPFLPRFYEEPARHALATQLFFLFQRIQQLRDLKQIDLFADVTVSDFLFDKDALFARLNLADDELHLYQQI